MADEPNVLTDFDGHATDGPEDRVACPSACPEEPEELEPAEGPDSFEDYDEEELDELSDEPSPRRKSLVRTVVIAVLVAVVAYGVGQFAYLHGGPILVPSALRSYEDGETASYRELSLRIDEVARNLDSDAYYTIDINEATEDVVSALLAETADEHAQYYDAGSYESYMKRMSGEYSGIGVSLTDVGPFAMVMDVYRGSPADKAGCQPYDVFLKIDGQEGPWTSEAVVKALEREEGSPVDVTFMRPTDDSLVALSDLVARCNAAPDDAELAAELAGFQLEGETVELHMTYEKFTIPNIESRMIGPYGYVRLFTFSQKAAGQVQEALKSLAEQGATGIVLDLRGNGGGMVDQAVDLVSEFVPEGVVVRIEGKNGVNERKVSGKVVCELPLVVLVDERTASASEITAGALKDHGRATVVGVTTYGKGTIQEIRKLSFGGALKYTMAEYTSPNGTRINKVGIAPDLVVELAEGNVVGEQGNDAQLDAALEALAGLVATAAQEAAAAGGGSEG